MWGVGGLSKFGVNFFFNSKSDPVDSNWVSTVADPTCVPAVGMYLKYQEIWSGELFEGEPGNS